MIGFLDTIKREWIYITNVRKALKRAAMYQPDDPVGLADVLEEKFDKHKANIAIRFEDKIYTYRELEERANQYAHWAINQGFKAGDTVALFMDNKPDYIAFWVGMSKVGIVTALINNQLQGAGLAHCVSISNARAIVMGPEQEELYASAKEQLGEDIVPWSLDCTLAGVSSIDPLLADLPVTRPERSHRAEIRGRDTCLYVYTSGTTGLPKAAKLTQVRVLGMLGAFVDSVGITERDRIYVTLPLYHATGGLCGVGQALTTGATLILARKFSASNFWDDAVKHKATSFAYIGELCRYLVKTDPHPLERQHTIRKGFGNGLRAEVWEKFVERFNIPHLVEFYGSTEGNVSFSNFDGKIGAVGRLPGYMREKIKTRIVKFDIAEEKPIRGEDGFCIETDIDEAGEAIGEIADAPRQRFDGYHDPKQTEKKILRDVFVPGDMWFRTGDLMKRDEHDYIYFVDRIGDTFRWKGENVSTNEVGEALSSFDDLELPNVYGVAMPETDGRAGMAGVNLKPGRSFDGKALAAHVDQQLPVYARPIFIRIQPEPETTGTLKYRKVDLVKQGYDISQIDDPVYVRLPGSDTYEPLTAEIVDDINSGKVRF